MSDTNSGHMVDSPCSRRKKLVIHRKRQHSLPPNSHGTGSLQTEDIQQRSPARRARSLQTSDMLSRKRNKSPGRRLTLKLKEDSIEGRSPKRHRTFDATASGSNICLRITLLYMLKKFILFVVVLLIGAIAFQFGAQFISLLDRKLSCHGGRMAVNSDHFKRELDGKLFGQHIAKQVILSAIPDYVGNTESHPLVIAMNGGTGVGKNHISNIIASELNTPLSKIIIPLHFPYINDSQAQFYEMQKIVEELVRMCAVNIILIDEIDKASSKAIFGLVTALNKLKETMKSSGTKLIVLLLNNSFGHDIAMYVYEETAVKMRQRNSLSYAEMQPLFTGTKRKTDPNVMWYRVIEGSGLLNFTLPFLPLMKKHVHLCVYRDLLMKHISEVTPDLINKISNELPYFPEKDQIFSKFGCKRVSDKVNYIML